MFVRRRRPLMRAAMVGGVAYHAGKKVQEGREADAQEAAPPPPAAGGDDTIEQLTKLGQLRDQGVLTEAEFEVQKQKLLQDA
jgi:hypothetical protein